MVAPAGHGITLLTVTTEMLVLTWALFLSRLGVRRWLGREAFRLDDYMMGLGLCLYTAVAGLVIVCCFHGAGRVRAQLTPGDMMVGTKLFFFAELLYAASTVPVKASICTTLVRHTGRRRWLAWCLHGVALASLAAAVVFVAGTARACDAVSAVWARTPPPPAGACRSDMYAAVGAVLSSVCIVTDWTLALLPAALLWDKEPLPRRVRVGAVCVCGLGAFASCALIVRLHYIGLHPDPGEHLFPAAPVALWSVVEVGVGIAAGCMTALRPVLDRVVVGGSGGGGSELEAVELEELELGPCCDGLAKMKRAHHGPARRGSWGGDGDGDGDSQRGILKETVVVMTTERCGLGLEAWQRTRVVGWVGDEGWPAGRGGTRT